MGGNTFRIVIRFIAGAYIIYLGYQLISGYINPTEETGDPAWYMLLFGIAFLAIGAFIIIDAIRREILSPKKESEESDSDSEGEETQEAIEGKEAIEDKEEEKEEEYIPPQTMTIAERIKRLSAEDDEEEAEDNEEPEESSDDTEENK